MPGRHTADMISDLGVGATLTRRGERASRGNARLSALVLVKRARIEILVGHHDDGLGGWVSV